MKLWKDFIASLGNVNLFWFFKFESSARKVILKTVLVKLIRILRDDSEEIKYESENKFHDVNKRNYNSNNPNNAYGQCSNWWCDNN